MLHFDGQSWSAVDSATTSNVEGLWGSGPDDVWAVAGGFSGEGAANLVHFDGNAWSVVDPGTTANLESIWGAAPDDVWATGRFEGGLLHFDGNAWSLSEDAPSGMDGLVAGSGPDDIWLARNTFSFSHDAGGGWVSIARDAMQFPSALWVNSPTDAWTVHPLEVTHWDGDAWSIVTDPALPGANGVWGSAQNQVTAVGSDASIYEYDGQSWTQVMSGGADLRAVGGSDASNRWAVGDAATVFRFEADQTEVTCTRVGGSCTLEAECGAGQGHLTDYSCEDSGAVCCVDSKACGGGEPQCCGPTDELTRPICHNGEFQCVGDSSPCPLTP
jgi:hypothetical protein